MILSVSRRTDIPAFYSDWFFNRVKAGMYQYRNPMVPTSIYEVPLNPKNVDCIVFWTKNPLPMLERLHILDERGFRYYFTYTLNGYGADMEPNVAPLEQRIKTFQRLAKLIGKNRVIWRYDPVVLTTKYDMDFHCERFAYLASQLFDSTEKCVFSFVDLDYKNTKEGNKQGIVYLPFSKKLMVDLAAKFAEIAHKHGLRLATCAEAIDLEKLGIEHNCCIDKSLIEDICGYKLKVGKDASQRKECHCVESIDMGANNTCLHGCKYCYANYMPAVVVKNRSKHDPEFPMLLKEHYIGDHVEQKKKTDSLRICSVQGKLF